MLKLTYLMPIPVSDEGPLRAGPHRRPVCDARPGGVRGSNLAPADSAAEIVVDGPHGSWCVHVAGAAL